MEKLLLLHGALGCHTNFNELKTALSEHYDVYCLDFYGHGSEAFSTEPFKIEGFSEQVFNWLEENNLDAVSIFGYSMGGYVALHLAAKHPEKVKRIFTLATKFDWNEASAEKETKLLDPDKIEAKVPMFANELSERHGEHLWKNVLRKTAEMMLALGQQKALSEEDLSQIEIPVLVSVGDRDPMVSLEETASVRKQLKNAALLVLPNTVHPLEKIPVARLVFECRQFFG
ncbi:alpha/beta fold hydrolase [Adhaeribacter terreus]|uniref:Alpha/beta fold hydrolase n=1 Tax=Adhaeribacter terreus TaxID=529703 RepID=A0ABW0EG29_9BACT